MPYCRDVFGRDARQGTCDSPVRGAIQVNDLRELLRNKN